MLTELIGLAAMLSLGVHLRKETTTATRIAILLIVLESIVWSVESWTQANPGHELMRALLTSSVYCLHPIIVVAIIAMIAPLEKRRSRLLLITPLVVYIPVVFTSQWTHIIFFIDENNNWNGNGIYLKYLPYAVFMIYAAIFTVVFILRYRRSGIKTLSAVMYIVAVGIAEVVLNMVTYTPTDYATLFSSVIVLYYLFLYTYMSKTDPLTGMLNRQTFYHDIADRDKKFTAVCSVDMNELKWINDSCGHKAGDDAIKTVSECLVADRIPGKTSYRVGGDEFILLYSGRNEEEVRQNIALMREKLGKTKYVCAFGYCMIDGDTDLEKAIQAADKAMYADKSELKRAVLAAGGRLHRRSGDR